MANLTVTVRYFAAAREAVKASEERLELPAGARVRDATAALAARHPPLARILPQLRVAVAQEFAQPDDELHDGDEVALIPPVAGGAPEGVFKVVDRPLTLDDVVPWVTTPGHGGVVTFTGVVRDASHGKTVRKLEYEAFVPMAEKKLFELGEEAKAKWPGVRVAVVHRVGTLAPGELAVVIATSAPHRKEAFLACEHLIERLKQEVPIWKKEHTDDGQVWVGLGP